MFLCNNFHIYWTFKIKTEFLEQSITKLTHRPRHLFHNYITNVLSLFVRTTRLWFFFRTWVPNIMMIYITDVHILLFFCLKRIAWSASQFTSIVSKRENVSTSRTVLNTLNCLLFNEYDIKP